MAESSSNNPDLTHALQTVAQNLLPPAFKLEIALSWGESGTRLFMILQFWLSLSKHKCPLDSEDKENDSSDNISKNHSSFGCIYSHQSSPFNTVDSVVNFGIKHEALDDDGSNEELKMLTAQ